MRKRAVFGIAAALLTLTIVGCAAAPLPGMDMAEEARAPADALRGEEAPAREAPAPDPGTGDAVTERLIIRNATVDIVVQDTEETVAQITSMADELGGYVIESRLRSFEEGVRAHLRIRVPAESLDVALERVREQALEVNSENITGQDVTDEYVDLRSRRRHLEATEERLLAFMDEAEDTEAALEVYDRLQNIQAQIEQVRGRMEYLEQSAAMATVTLEITPSRLAQPLQVGRWQPRGTVRDAFASLIRVLQFFVDALIVIVVLIAPVAAVIALPLIGAFLVIRGLVRRRQKREKQA